MLKLVCIDVDGTLVGSSGSVLEEVWEATREARRRGQHLVLCTGRPAFGKALGYAKQLDPEGWHIFQNGASIYHVQTEETLSVPFPQELLPDFEKLGKEKNWVLELYNPVPGVMDNVPASRGYSGGFGVDLMLKDLGLAAEAAMSVKSPAPLGELARNLYALHSARGAGALDFYSIIDVLK